MLAFFWLLPHAISNNFSVNFHFLDHILFNCPIGVQAEVTGFIEYLFLESVLWNMIL